VIVSPRKSTETAGTPLPAVSHRKPRPDLYTVLLAIALAAVLVGIVFLYLEMNSYEFKLQGAPPVGMVKQWPVASGQWLVASSAFNVQRSAFPSPLAPSP
jgi:hypothetical protein